MKIRPSIFLFTVIATLAIALALWYGKKKVTETPLATLVETNIEPQAIPGQSLQGDTSTHTNISPTQRVSNATPPSNLDKGEQIKEGLAVLNDVPIVFYGRLEDQFGKPVIGAQVAASIRIYNDVQSTVQRSSVISDDNGFFKIKGGKGESLGVVPSKNGYVLATANTYFKYSYMYPDHFTPDEGNPTVIKMWKLQGAEPLINISQRHKLHYTNTPIHFDLITGQIVPNGGDIKIMVNRSPGIIDERNPQDWGFEIEAVEGGIIDSEGRDRVTFVAPDEGYQPTYSFIFSTKAPYKWQGGFNRGFFVKSRNGRVYTKLGISLNINNTPDGIMNITFGGTANTNSSRNWEASASQ